MKEIYVNLTLDFFSKLLNAPEGVVTIAATADLSKVTLKMLDLNDKVNLSEGKYFELVFDDDGIKGITWVERDNKGTTVAETTTIAEVA